MPRSSATCAIGRSLSSANPTPRSSNSSGYFLALDMTAENLLSPGQHPRIEVPAKPGPAQPQVQAITASRTIVTRVTQVQTPFGATGGKSLRLVNRKSTWETLNLNI